MPSAIEAQSPNHWATREAPLFGYFFFALSTRSIGGLEEEWEGETTAIFAFMSAVGKHRAPRENAHHLDSTIQTVRKEVARGGGCSPERSPNAGSTGLLQFHLTGSQSLTTTPGPWTSSALREPFPQYLFRDSKKFSWTSLALQWLGICLPRQGAQIQSLVGEDSTCLGATKPMRHNY